MARIKKFAGDIPQGLSQYNTFIVDGAPNSEYFRITEFKDTFTGGKNGFLIEGSEFLRESTEIKIEILDVEGNTVYYEPGDGVPEYYEGLSKVIAVYVYEDTPVGVAKITVLGEAKQYRDGGVIRDIPTQWQGVYNVKWEREFKINKNLTNEDKVRFYRRPTVSITEIERPIFTANPVSVTQTGTVLGTPIVPSAGTTLSTFPRPAQYLLSTLDGTKWTGSVIDSTITIDGTDVLQPLEVASETELIVSTPYTNDNGVVVSFDSKPYSTTFNYLQNDDGLGTALSGSFGKFIITNLETFVGDVHRVRVFRTSQADLTDFQFVQEIVLESTEILIDYDQSQRDEESYGLFTPYVVSNYWTTSSNDIQVEFNQNRLFNSVKLDSTGENTFHTTETFSVTNELEYTLSFNTRIDSVDSDNSIEVYLQGTKNGTTKTQSIGTITSSGELLQKTYQEFNFKADDFDSASLYFKVVGEGWYVSTVSLRAASETSFSPDEITFIQTVPRTLDVETFDFRFEFYDINNNYIPVEVTATQTFTAGNLNDIDKSIEIVPTALYFQFDSGSQQGNAVPPKRIFFNINKQFLTGSTTWTSASYDNENNLIDDGPYSATFYPGILNDVSTEELERYELTVENFTGSIYETVVQYVTYTAECEGVSDNITITRVSDGKGGVNFEIRPFRGTTIRNNNTSSLEVQAVRIDGLNVTNLQEGLPLDYSVPKLYVNLGTDETPSFKVISDAVTDGDIDGFTAGVLGSGEIDYNAILDRDGIDGQRTLYLIPSNNVSEDAILATLTLTDLLDGLDRGFIKYDVDTFTINERTETVFTPTKSKVTGSFYRRGTSVSPVSGNLEIYPSMSINSDFNPEFWMYYITGTFANEVTVSVTDENDNSILPQNPLQTFDGSTRAQHKQLNVTYTYTEPYTFETVNVDQTFQIVPEGKPGQDAIVVELDPKIVTLQATENRQVISYAPSITEIKVKQGQEDTKYLTWNEERNPGTFYIDDAAIIGQDINFGGFSSADTGNTFVITDEAEDMTNLESTTRATITYPIEIRPFYTSSYYTTNVSQSFVRSDAAKAGRSLSLRASSNTVTRDGDGLVTSPLSNITLTATSANTTGSNYFFFYKDGNFVSQVFNGSNVATLDIDSGDFPAGGELITYTVELHDGNNDRLGKDPEAQASTTISGIQDGVSTYIGVVENPNGVGFVDVYDILNLDNTGTKIFAYKGNDTLTCVTVFPFPEFDPTFGTVIPNGKYTVTITDKSPYIDLAGSLDIGSKLSPNVDGIAEIAELDNWTGFRDPTTLQPTTSASAFIEYTIDFEDGRASEVVRQNLTISYEGNIGPGIIMRGEWTGSLDYKFDVPAKRRDAVFLTGSNAQGQNETHYFATTANMVDAGSPPYTYKPFSYGAAEFDVTDPPEQGEIDGDTGWQYLGVEDFFIAAKIAIFEESFVKNTINVGNNFGNEFANIVIAGGRVDPYIAIGQNGTAGTSGIQSGTNIIGYNSPGIFMGTYDAAQTFGGGGIKTPRFSLRSETDGSGRYRSLTWDGSSLSIRGAISQTPDGDNIGRVLGAWDDLADGFEFFVNDIVTNDTITWECILAHIKDVDEDLTYIDEPGVGSSYTTYWQESNIAAKSIRLSADTQIFRKAKDGTITPSYIAFTANKENIASDTTWATDPVGIDLYTDAATGTTTVTGDDTVFLRIADFGSNTAVKVTATAGGFSDEITVVLLEEGSDAITVINTNQSHTLPSDGDGVVTDYAGSGTTISVYEGTNHLDYDGSGTTAGHWKITTSQIPPTTIQTGSITDSTNDAVIGDHSNMSNAASTVLLNYNISGKRLNGTDFTAETSQTITKTSAAKTLRLAASSQTFREAKDGTLSPDWISFVANKQNTDLSTTWSTSPTVTLYEDSTGPGTDVNGDNTVYLRKADFGSNNTVTVTATAGALSDSITIVRLIEGSDSVLAVLSNETHTIPADSDGSVDAGSYGGSGTKIFVYEGVTLLDYDGVGTSAGHWTVSAAGVGIDEGSISESGDIAVVGEHSNFLTAPISASVTYTITGKKLNGDSFSLEKVQTFSKAVKGVQGNTGRGILFRGEWTSSVDYYTLDTRQDVVKYSANTSNPYWLCRVTHTSSPSNPPPSSGATSTTEWESFGATFASVATDILFAQEVYADQTVYIGTEGESNLIVLDASNTTNPFISIGQGTSRGYNNDGIFAGFDGGTAKLSIKDTDTGLFYDGTNVVVSGSLNSTDGNIGGFTIGEHTISTQGLILGDYTQDDAIDAGPGEFRVTNTGNVIMKGANSGIGSAMYFVDTSDNYMGYIRGERSAGNQGVNIRGHERVFLGVGLLSVTASITINGDAGAAWQNYINGNTYSYGNFRCETLQSSNTASLVGPKNFGGGEMLTNDIESTTEIRCYGNIIAYYSDERLKTNLGKIENPLSKINSLNGFYFKTNELAKKFGYDDDEVQVGVSAQEVYQVMPEIVKDAPFNYAKKVEEVFDDDGTIKEYKLTGEYLYDIDENDRYKTVQYDRLVPLLIEGIKELSAKVDSLESEIQRLKE